MHGWWKKSVLRRYIITYVSVAVAACAVLGAVLILLSGNSLKRQEKEAVETRLLSAAEDFSYQMQVMDDLALQIRTTNFYQPMYLRQNSYNEVLMLENFALLSGASMISDHYYLLYEDVQEIFSQSGKLSLEVYLRHYGVDHSAQSFLELLHDEGRFFTMRDAYHGDQLFCKKQIIFNSYSRNVVAYMLFPINVDKLIERYGSLLGQADELALQVDGYSILGTPREELSCEVRWPYREGEIRFGVRRMNNGRLYNMIVPMLYIVIGMSALFAIISVRLARQSYIPIKTLTGKLEPHAPVMEDEIAAISHAVDELVNKNTHSMAQLTGCLEDISHLQASLRQQILLITLSGEYDPAIGKRMTDVGIDLSGGYFCVAHIAYHETVSTEELERRIRTISDGETKLYLAELVAQRGWAVLISTQDEANLLPAYDTLNEALTDVFPGLRIAKGASCRQVHQLAYSLAVAESAQGSAEGNLPEELQSMDIMKDLKHFMQTGNEEQAVVRLETLLDCVERYPSVLFRRYRMVEITYQIMSCAKAQGCQLEEEQIRNSINHQDVRVVRELLENTVRRICAAVPTVDKGQMPAGSKLVIEYIEQHASDYDVCLDSVATACGISMKQVSRIVRSAVDMSFKEYVTSLRMRRAMALLKEGLSSTDTAHQVGYSDISHFTKIFKANTGMTPGQYRSAYWDTLDDDTLECDEEM